MTETTDAQALPNQTLWRWAQESCFVLFHFYFLSPQVTPICSQDLEPCVWGKASNFSVYARSHLEGLVKTQIHPKLGDPQRF